MSAYTPRRPRARAHLFADEGHARVVHGVLGQHVEDARVLLGRAPQRGQTRGRVVEQILDLHIRAG